MYGNVVPTLSGESGIKVLLLMLMVIVVVLMPTSAVATAAPPGGLLAELPRVRTGETATSLHRDRAG